MDYYIFRHGETYESKHGIHYTANNVESAQLLPEGLATIEKMAKYLSGITTHYNVSSPLVRCVKTVEIVERETAKQFVYDKRLTEYVFQLGETFDEYAARLKNFWEELRREKYGAVAICTHGAGIAALKHYVTHGSFTLAELPDYPRPGILTIIKNGEVKEINFNEVS